MTEPEMNDSRIQVQGRLELVIISPRLLISEALSILDRAGMGVLLLCEGDRKFVGILTDGDIRRAIIRGVSLEQPCMAIASLEPVVAPVNISPALALHLMDHNQVNHLPVVDAEGRVADLLLRRDLIFQDQLALSAVIMAGGLGTRLRPLTEALPKPMLPMGNRPLMEITIDRLRQAGIQDVLVTTYYRGERIKEYFGDGSKFGIRMSYIEGEEYPLGTAGALGLLPPQKRTMLVINGDILTTTNYETMYDFHKKNQAVATVAVRQYTLKVPYGVVECEGLFFRELQEKPTIPLLVNAGIYLLEPSALQLIGHQECLDMPTLIRRLKEKEQIVVVFPIIEQWLDIGDHQAYQQAQIEEAEQR